MKVPARLVEAVAADVRRRPWLAALPERVAAIAQLWGLELGEPFEPGGVCGWVAPTVGASGRPAVLKVACLLSESRDEAAGLRALGPDTAVEVYADETVGDCMFLLLERCEPGHGLNVLQPEQRDEVIASLLRRTWSVGSVSGFRPLADMCNAWADETQALLDIDPTAMDPALAADGLAAFRELATPRPDDTLLCTDLHAGNILASTRKPWLLIDPKPFVGDRHYDVLQHLYNEERLLSDPVELVGRMADLCDLDRNRLRQWMFARCVQEGVASPELQPVARSLA